MAAHNLHPLNRRMVIADNLEMLRRLDNDAVDLIVTDPPFAKNYAFTGNLKPPLSPDELELERRTLADWGINNRGDAETASVEWPEDGGGSAGFSDIWTWENDIHEEWLDAMETFHPAAAKVIDSTRFSHSDGHAAYLSYMAVRLIEMRRVLKPTGSLFLHCDATANSYLRQMLDAVFGTKNFRNEIVWSYRTGGASRTRFSSKHDTIFFYSKTSQWTYNQPKEKSYTKSKTRKPGVINYGGGKAEFFEDEQGVYNLVNMRDVWDIPYIGSTDPERTGYPTQKPVALAERIIGAASRPGDVVLDPFAGCAYVPVAAERLGRQWIACDINPRALTVVRRQFNKFHYAVDGQNPDLALDEGRQTTLLADAEIKIIRPADMPPRTTENPIPAPAQKPRPRQFKHPSSHIPKAEMRDFLLRLSEWRCWTCGFANTVETAPGTYRLDQSADNFELDHITPLAQGGDHQITNRAALCPSCNRRKSGRDITLTAFIQENIRECRLRVPSPDQLVDLARARHEAREFYVKYRSQNPTGKESQ